jgi:hypothetical protein
MSRSLTRVHLTASTLLLALAASAAGAPPYTDSYRVKERSAYAGFNSPSDFSGCIQTSVNIAFVESAQRYGSGKQEPTAWGYVSIYRYDRCHQYQTLLSAYGYRELQPDEMDFQGNLALARLNTTFDLVDSVTHTTHSATVDLTWTATGPSTHTQERYSGFGPGFRYSSSQLGTSRPAEAAGSVRFDSAEVLDGPSDYGAISNIKSGSISIYRD